MIPPLTHTEMSSVVSGHMADEVAVSYAITSRPPHATAQPLPVLELTTSQMGYMSIACWVIVYRYVFFFFKRMAHTRHHAPPAAVAMRDNNFLHAQMTLC